MRRFVAVHTLAVGVLTLLSAPSVASAQADNAVKFLEYLASAQAQDHFAHGNNEWPVARGIAVNNPALQAMTGGAFKSETLPISIVGMNQVKVQQMLDRAGFK